MRKIKVEFQNKWAIPLVILISSTALFHAITYYIGMDVTFERYWGELWTYYCILGYYMVLGLYTVLWFDYLKRHNK